MHDRWPAPNYAGVKALLLSLVLCRQQQQEQLTVIKGHSVAAAQRSNLQSVMHSPSFFFSHSRKASVLDSTRRNLRRTIPDFYGLPKNSCLRSFLL